MFIQTSIGLLRPGARICGLKLIQRASVEEKEIQSGSGPDPTIPPAWIAHSILKKRIVLQTQK